MPEIAEIIAEIKAKVHNIDAQLNAIEVGEWCDEPSTLWQIACEQIVKVKTLMTDFPKTLDTQSDFHATIQDLRSSTNPLLIGIDLLDFDDYAISDVTKAQLHSVRTNTKSLFDSYNDLVERFIARG